LALRERGPQMEDIARQDPLTPTLSQREREQKLTRPTPTAAADNRQP